MKTNSVPGSGSNSAQPLNRTVSKLDRHRITAAGAAFLVAAMFGASAQAQPTITNLGVLGGGNGSFGNAISANGLVVTGSSTTSAGVNSQRAFRWTAAGGMQNLGILSGGIPNYSSGGALSADGAVVTGISARTDGNNRGFRWTAATGMQSIGILGAGTASAGNAISSNGSVIAGFSSLSGNSGATAIRWTAATGIQSLNFPDSNAFGISADGSVIVGVGFPRPWRWTAIGGKELLNLSNGAIGADAYAISADGAVVAGSLIDSSFSSHAFRSTGFDAGGGGVMQDLGVLDGGDGSIAWGLNGDGSVVVGSCTLPEGDHAVLWTSTLGMVDLNSYLPSRGVNLTDWTLHSARGISADGSAMTGYGTFNGATRAFLVRGLNPLNGQEPSAPLLTTITNPTPANFGLFGGAVAAQGSDRVLISAEGAGAAYLFSTTGTLMTTFRISDPAVGSFGAALAAVGGDLVLIGAYGYSIGSTQAGRAYLFSTSGTLQTTFTNPAPATVQAFGWSVASVGSDRVLISGLPDVNNPPPYRGGVYLFSTNGTLLTTFTNPTPAVAGEFGAKIAALGCDRVLIGSPGANTGASQSGVAYLFSTNGTLLTTFTNPVPAVGDNFGTAVAAVGSDRVLISAIDYGGTKGSGGAAYLFSTNGTLLSIFTNPTPAAFDYFGWSVAAVGSTRVLIGAYQDGTAASQAGSAYLFSTNGTLLNTFTNPTPALQDWFGLSVAAVGTDRVLIGGVWDDTGAKDSGSAYLFDLPFPALSIALSNAATVSVHWVTPETGLSLQQAGVLGTPAAWSDSSDSISLNGLTNVVQQELATTNRFFRLRRP